MKDGHQQKTNYKVSVDSSSFAKTVCAFHPLESRKEGPRIPRVYGTGPTMICGVCGAWSPDWGCQTKWYPAETLTAAMEDDA